VVNFIYDNIIFFSNVKSFFKKSAFFYGKTRVKRVLEYFCSSSTNPQSPQLNSHQNPSNQEAFTVLNEWRALHALPLVRLRTNIHNYFKENKKE